jgi:hypothetical protein
MGGWQNYESVLFYFPCLLYFPNFLHWMYIAFVIERKLKTDVVAQKYGSQTKQVIKDNHSQTWRKRLISGTMEASPANSKTGCLATFTVLPSHSYPPLFPLPYPETRIKTHTHTVRNSQSSRSTHTHTHTLHFLFLKMTGSLQYHNIGDHTRCAWPLVVLPVPIETW